MELKNLKGGAMVLTRWLRWLECRLVHQKVAGSISSQGTNLGCGFGPKLGGAYRKQPTDVSLSHQCLSLYLPLCLSLLKNQF